MECKQLPFPPLWRSVVLCLLTGLGNYASSEIHFEKLQTKLFSSSQSMTGLISALLEGEEGGATAREPRTLSYGAMN